MNPKLLAMLARAASMGLTGIPIAGLISSGEKTDQEAPDLSQEDMIRAIEKQAAINYAASPAHQDRLPSLNKELEASDEQIRQARMNALKKMNGN
jgi:sugar phosphate isomerase/epimerase